MIKYILFALIILYCIYVTKKIIKNLKAGKCMGCNGGECTCNCKENKF